MPSHSLVAAMTGFNAAAWIFTVARLPAIVHPCTGCPTVLSWTDRHTCWPIGSRIRSISRPCRQSREFTSPLPACLSSASALISSLSPSSAPKANAPCAFRMSWSWRTAFSAPSFPRWRSERNASKLYGISQPSEKVGGDLVDAITLPSGDLVAFLADISGHGLPASILMGRLKTAARTALLDAGDREPGETIPVSSIASIPFCRRSRN